MGLLTSLDSGQAFRWKLNDDGTAEGVLNNRFYIFSEKKIKYLNKDDNAELFSYFNCDYDWNEIKDSFKNIHPYLFAATEEYPDLRILKQDPFETLVSFIISSCNNISRIKKIIESICKNFGNRIDDEEHYSFPSKEKFFTLSKDDLDVCRIGFRSEYIIDAVMKVENGDIDLDSIYSMDTDKAEKYLMKIKGVGTKVADCILLFAYNKFDAFPKDVWIKKVMREKLKMDDEKQLGPYCGVAQQFLFMKIRNESIR